MNEFLFAFLKTKESNKKCVHLMTHPGLQMSVHNIQTAHGMRVYEKDVYGTALIFFEIVPGTK
jgi:hypothetical protein